MHSKSKREKMFTNLVPTLAVIFAFAWLHSSSIRSTDALPMDCPPVHDGLAKCFTDFGSTILDYDTCTRNSTLKLAKISNATVTLNWDEQDAQHFSDGNHPFDFTILLPKPDKCFSEKLDDNRLLVSFAKAECNLVIAWDRNKKFQMQRASDHTKGDGVIPDDDGLLVSLSADAWRVARITDNEEDELSRGKWVGCVANLGKEVNFALSLSNQPQNQAEDCAISIRFDERYELKDLDAPKMTSTVDPSRSSLSPITKSVAPLGSSSTSTTSEGPSVTEEQSSISSAMIILIVVGVFIICVVFACVIYWAIRLRFRDETREQDVKNNETLEKEANGSENGSDAAIRDQEEGENPEGEQEQNNGEEADENQEGNAEEDNAEEDNAEEQDEEEPKW